MAMSNTNNEHAPPQMGQEEAVQQNWAELNRDILMVIFQLVGTIDVLKSTGCVCRAWREVAKDEPQLWRRIDMTNHNMGFDAFVLTNPARMAIDRSGDRLEEFSIKGLGDDDLLQYLSDRTSVLKSLRLIACSKITNKGVINTVKKQPLLEDLQITYGWWSTNFPELVGKAVPNLKHFKLNDCPYLFPPKEKVDHKQAFGIAKTMHQLRSLQLTGNTWLSNEGLKAILEGCPHLESLDITRCYNVIMNADMRARCARLTTLRLPGADDYDYESESEEDSD